METVSENAILDGYAHIDVGNRVNFDVVMSDNINEIATALSKAQAELEAAKKGQEGYGYKYSDLASVIASAKPVLAKHGLAVVQLVGRQTDKYVSVTTILTHSSGQFFKSEGTLPVINMKGTNEAQNAGASLSYLRRYAYQAIIGQPSEDNDASSEGFDKKKKGTSFSGKKTSSPTNRQKFRSPKKTKVNDDDDDI